MRSIRNSINKIVDPFRQLLYNPLAVSMLTAFVALLYVIAEWIFLFTRPSFLKTVPLLEKLGALSITASLAVLAGMLAVLVLTIPGYLIKYHPFRRILTALSLLIPSAFLSALILLLVDNFTYTVFHFGIVSTHGAWRAVYAVLFSLLFLYLSSRLADLHNLLTIFFGRIKPLTRLILPVVIIVLATLGVIVPVNLSELKTEAGKQRTAESRNQLPDILLITVDAVNSEYTSIYGNERDTTPFLRNLSTTSLKGDNHFANAQGTIGSLTSLLTGKYPADERVIYSSDMLQGANAYQHLPGILNSFGYYTVQISNATYADAYKTNFLSAFDEANGRGSSDQPITHAINTIYPGIPAIFQNEVMERISARIQHIFYIRDMNNPYQEVTEAPKKFNDIEKIDELETLLDERREPLFIHLHWMGTHGPNYFPENQVFSEGLDMNDQGTNRQLFYYDSILEFDSVMADLYTFLSETNRLDNTILVITSDHSQKWTNSRIPLIIHFPNDMYSKEITVNTENIDIAPTLLDYLGIPQPMWMSGQSLISDNFQERPIFTAKIPKSTKDSLTGKVIYPDSVPPFFQFGRMSVVVCNQWFELNLTEKTLVDGKVVGYTRICKDEITPTQAVNLIIGHLKDYGFETDSLIPLRNKLEEIPPP